MTIMKIKNSIHKNNWKHFRLSFPFIWVILVMTTELTSCNSRKQTDEKFDSTDEQSQLDEIKKLENARLAAGINKDVAFFDSATADDYTQIDFDGNVLNKAQTLERIKSSYAQLQSNVVEDMDVRIYSNVAILTGLGNPKGTMKGEEFRDRVRYTRVYVKREGNWKVVLFQQTRVPKDK